MHVLDLFSGIGGFSLGLERAGMTTVAFCEADDYARRVLAKHWPGVPIHHDVRKLRGSDVGAVDVVCGGYPCQPFSLAGKRRGAEDDRHLWPEMRRLVDELRPAWVVGENVAGHIGMGLDDVLSDLEALNYACRPFVIPAVAVDARHRRDRVWIIAHAAGGRHGRHGEGLVQVPASVGPAMANALCGGQQGQRRPLDASNPTADADWQVDRVVNDGGWPPEPGVGRMAHGVPNGVDRLGRLGNAVVPQIPEIIGRAILAAEAMPPAQPEAGASAASHNTLNQDRAALSLASQKEGN